MNTKHQLRKDLRQRRQKLTKQERLSSQQAIRKYLLPLIKRGRKIGVYMAFGSEMDLSLWVKSAQKRGAQLYIPQIERHKKRLWFTPLNPDTKMTRHRMGMLQGEGRKIRADYLHSLLLPLIGVDCKGYRLGQGGGYYDATLASMHTKNRPNLFGVGFSVQQCTEVPKDTWDMPLDAYICEAGWQYFR